MSSHLARNWQSQASNPSLALRSFSALCLCWACGPAREGAAEASGPGLPGGRGRGEGKGKAASCTRLCQGKAALKPAPPLGSLLEGPQGAVPEGTRTASPGLFDSMSLC